MRRNTLLILTTLTLALVVAACGSSTEPVAVRNTTPPTPSSPATADPAPIVLPPAATAAPGVPTPLPVRDVTIGNSVGDRIPEFYFSLADGTKVSSDNLVEEAKPAYLFFFATW